MAALRPWVRKEKVKDIHGFAWKKVLHRVQDLESKNARVRQLLLPDLPRSAPPATRQTLHAKKIPLRISLGERRQEGSVTATEIDFERRGASEDFAQIQRSQDALRDDHGRGKGGAVGSHSSGRTPMIARCRIRFRAGIFNRRSALIRYVQDFIARTDAPRAHPSRRKGAKRASLLHQNRDFRGRLLLVHATAVRSREGRGQDSRRLHGRQGIRRELQRSLGPQDAAPRIDRSDL